MLDAGVDTKNYEDTLNRQWGDVPKEILLPAGSYRLKLKKAAMPEPREEGDVRKAFFIYTVVEPCDDVDIAKFSALSQKDVAALDLVKDFWMQKKRDFVQHTAHMAKHGVDVSKAGSREEAMKLLVGSEIIAFIEPETYVSKKTGEAETVNRLKDFAALN